MSRAFPRCIGLLFAAGAILPGRAQSLAEALRLLPAGVREVETFQDLAMADGRMGQVSARVTGEPFPGFLRPLAQLRLPARDLAKGPVLLASLGAPGKPSGQVFVVPVRDFKALVKDLQAVKDGSGFRGRAADQPLFLAGRGRFALLAREKDLLGPFPPKQGLDRELAGLVPWLSRRSTAVVIPAPVVQARLEEIRRRQAEAQLPGTQAAAALLQPLMQSLAESGSHLAVALDLPEDGSLQFHARLCLRPASPAAQAMAALPLIAGCPMAGLPMDNFLMAAGGPWPQSASRALGGFLTFSLARALPGDAKEKTRELGDLQVRMMQAIQGGAFILGTPARPGDPVLGRLRGLVRVSDARAYLDLLERNARTQEAAGLAPWVQLSLRKEDQDGRPLLTQVQTLDLARMPGTLRIPPMQMKMLMVLMFGSAERLAFTTGMVDDHTVMTVLGGADSFREALKAAGAFQEDPGVVRADRMLPATALWRFYVDVKGIHDLGETFLAGFAPARARQPLPQVPPAPPLALGLECTPAGIELTAAAAPETLDALGALARGFKQALPGPRSAAVRH